MKSLGNLALLAAAAMLPDAPVQGDEFLFSSFSADNVTANSEPLLEGCQYACPRCGGRPSQAGQKPWSLFGNCRRLNECGVQVRSYVQQSFATDSRNPTNPAAGFGTWPGGGFIYRNDEYTFNRLYMTIARPANTRGCGWDIGGQVDLLYGADYVFLQARGLETHGDFSPKWNADSGSGFGGVGLMGLAMPQVFAEVARDDLSVKIGHFYHPGGFIGFDPVKGVMGNTNTYTLIYNSNLPGTGVLAQWTPNDRLTLGGGFHRGSANWEDNNDVLNGVGFVTWRFCDGKSSLKYVFDIGAEDDAGRNQEYYQSVVFDWKIRERWTYVFQSHYRHIQNGAPGGGDDHFYSVVNRLAYEINEKWIVGVRYEWFDDTNGTAVFPNSPGPGIWHELAFGGTYKWSPNVWLRPQIRWDWFDADPGVGPGPWGDNLYRSRFIAAFSLFTFF